MTFPPLAALVVAWVAQAIHAYREAVDLGAQPGGQLQAALFLPVAVTALTLFWLVGGRHGSPTATVKGYVISWVTGRSQLASRMYITPPTSEQLESTWATQSAYLTGASPRWQPSTGRQAGSTRNSRSTTCNSAIPSPSPTVARWSRWTSCDRSRWRRIILGFIPTASQETVVVEPAGSITVTLIDQPAPGLAARSQPAQLLSVVDR